MKSTDLTKSCVFLKLHLSRLGDKRGVSSDAIEVDADKDFVKVRKIIFKCHEFDSIRSLDGQIRRYLRDTCLPYEKGLYLLPGKMVELVVDKLKDLRTERERRVKEFVPIYPELKAKAPDILRALFEKEDFRDGEWVENEFSMDWEILMLSTAMELENISSEIFREERKKWATKMEEAFENIRFLLRESLLELLTDLREKLEPDNFGLPKRLGVSSFKAMSEFLSTVDLRNATNDSELALFSQRIRQLMDGVDIEAVKHADGFRENLHRELSKIETALEASVTTAPRRRIRMAS